LFKTGYFGLKGTIVCSMPGIGIIFIGFIIFRFLINNRLHSGKLPMNVKIF
jgi:uncharacterized protein YqgC (DUF456 family)